MRASSKEEGAGKLPLDHLEQKCFGAKFKPITCRELMKTVIS
jgi:hypothetical protein